MHTHAHSLFQTCINNLNLPESSCQLRALCKYLLPEGEVERSERELVWDVLLAAVINEVVERFSLSSYIAHANIVEEMKMFIIELQHLWGEYGLARESVKIMETRWRLNWLWDTSDVLFNYMQESERKFNKLDDSVILSLALSTSCGWAYIRHTSRTCGEMEREMWAAKLNWSIECGGIIWNGNRRSINLNTGSSETYKTFFLILMKIEENTFPLERERKVFSRMKFHMRNGTFFVLQIFIC